MWNNGRMQNVKFRKRTYTARQFARDGAALAGAAPRLAQVYLLREIEPRLRERIWLAVSGVNNCRHCLFVHSAWARRAGVNDREVEALEHGRPDPDAQSDEAAVTFMQAWAERDFRGAPAEVTAWFEDVFAPPARDKLRAVAQLANFSNRTGNTFDALLSRVRGRANPDGRLLDEAIVSAAFLGAAAVVAPVLAVATGRGPIRLWSDFRALSQRHES